MRNPRDFFKPLAIDAPEPLREIPFKPSRMIHFLDFSNEKMVAKVPDIAPTVDILLGNLEDAVPVDRKLAARAGLIKVGKEMDLGDTALWTRVNELASPWVLDDIGQIIAEIGMNPPLIPLAVQITSGVTPNVWAANICPVRPKPVMISSKISRTLFLSQISRSLGRYSSGGSMIPPVCPIGSTMIAATVEGSSMSITLSTILAQVRPQVG